MSNQSPIKRLSLPALPINIDPQIREFLAAVKLWAEMREGVATGLNDGFVTRHDIDALLNPEAKFVLPGRTNGAGLYGAKNILGYFDGSDWLAFFEMTSAGGKFYAGDGANDSITLDPTSGVLISSNAASPIAVKKIAAYDSNGLALTDDSGQGPLVNDGGAVTNAYQPAFSASLTTAQAFTVGSWATIAFDAEDYGDAAAGDFSTTTHKFVASIAGKYSFNAVIQIDNADSAAIEYVMRIYTTNYSYYNESGQTLSTDGFLVIQIPIDTYLDVGDEVYVQVYQYGGTDQASVDNNSSTTKISWFTGHLIA